MVSGLILENGASIQHDGTGYTPVAGNPSSTAILTEDGSRYVMAADGADGLVSGTVCGLKASLAVDVQGYAPLAIKYPTETRPWLSLCRDMLTGF